jgi:hypothetical protein
MSKHSNRGNRARGDEQSRNPPSDDSLSSKVDQVDHDASLALLMGIQLFCCWTAPFIEESIAGLLRLEKYPTADTYRDHIEDTSHILESAAPIISRLKALESVISGKDRSNMDLNSFKSEVRNLAETMREFIGKSYGVRENILATFQKSEAARSSQSALAEISEESLAYDQNSTIAMLLNIERLEAQALATVGIFANQNEGISIADVLAGCAFLPFNIAASASQKDPTSESEVLSISPEIVASALNTAFFGVREMQKQLLNYCIQSSLSEWEEEGGPQLFFDVLQAMSSENFDSFSFDEKKVQALRAIARHSSPIRVYEDAGGITASFLVPDDIQQYVQEAGAVITYVLANLDSELRSLNIQPVAITRKCGEMLEIGLSLCMQCSGELKPNSKEVSVLMHLHSKNPEFVGKHTQIFDCLSLGVHLEKQTSLEIELPREFFESREDCFDQIKMLRNAIDLCQEIKGVSLLKLERLPGATPDFDELNSEDQEDELDGEEESFNGVDLGEVTVFGENVSSTEASRETPISRLDRLYRIWKSAGVKSPEDLGSENSNVIFRAPASWLADSELNSTLMQLGGIVEFAKLDLIASRENLFNEDLDKPPTKFITDLTGLVRSYRSRLIEYERPLLFMPVKAGLLAQDGTARFYLSTNDGKLIGIGGVPVENSSIPTLTIFPPHRVELSRGLVANVTQSLKDSQKKPGPLMYKVQSLLLQRGWALSESILSEVLDQYEEAFSPLPFSEVASIIYTNISGNCDRGLIMKDNYQLTGASTVFKLAILTRGDSIIWNVAE